MLKIRLNFVLLLLVLNSRLFSQTELPPTFVQTRIKQPFKLCQTINEPNQATEVGIASDNENVFIALTNGNLKSINIINGTINWEDELGGRIIAAPYLFEENLIIVSKTVYKSEADKNQEQEKLLQPQQQTAADFLSKTDTAVVRLVDRNDGLVKWQIRLEISLDSKVAVHDFGKLLVIATGDDFYLLNKTDGKISARRSFQAPLSATPFFDQDRIIFGTSDRSITEISAKTFEVMEKVSVSAVPTVVFSSGESLFWGDQTGKVSRLEKAIKPEISKKKKENTRKKSYQQKWSLRVGGKISEILPFRKNVLVTSLDNYIYSVSAENGEVVWKQRLSGRPAFQPFLTGNHLTVLSVGSPTALMIDALTGKTTSKINIENENFFTDSPGGTSVFLFFPTVRGIFFYASDCRSSSEGNGI